MNIDISPHLCYLLCRNNIAVLPGFGAFVASDAPAVAEYATGKIYPPYSVLVFNEHSNSNDTSLYELLAKKEALSVEEGRAIVWNFVSNMKSMLKQKETVHLPGIGCFFLDSTGTIAFDPTEFSAFNLHSYGLPVLQCRPLQKLQKEYSANQAPVQREARAPEKESQNKAKSWFRRRAFAYGLASVFMCILLFVAATYQRTVTADGAEALIVPTGETRVNVRPVPESIADDEQPENPHSENAVADTLTFEMDVPAVIANGEAKVELKSEVKISKTAKTIIVGTFSQTANVERVARRLTQSNFLVYKKKQGRLTRIGAVLTNLSGKEQSKALVRLQKMFGKEIWELEKNDK